MARRRRHHRQPAVPRGKRLRSELTDDYVEALFDAYRDRVPQEADLVAYWMAKAWEAVTSGRTKRVGLVTTNSIRGGANRRGP